MGNNSDREVSISLRIQACMAGGNIMLDQNKTGLIVVDIQGRLARLVDNSEEMISNVQRLIKGCRILSMPIIWLEQIPEKLGDTVPEISKLLEDQEPIAKLSFGGCGNEKFIQTVKDSSCHQWLICGIETHICVYQTVCGLLDMGHQVEVVSDAVSSRVPANKALALNKVQALGAGLTSVEMCIYELMKRADHLGFKSMLPLFK